MEIVNGKELAAGIYRELSFEINQLRLSGFSPTLAIINIEGDAASEVYIRNKRKIAEEIGVLTELHRYPPDTSEKTIADLINRLNNDDRIHGILLQLPIPDHLNKDRLLNLISPDKDVDGLTHINQGRLMAGDEGLFPCTPSGVMYILHRYHPTLSGVHVAVIGRSILVGKPLAQMLLGADCTVSILHSKSRDKEAMCRSADIVVSAVGRPLMVDDTWIKNGATVIDVGINRIYVDGVSKIVGDVDFDKASKKAALITKVPGGVGPMTVAFLMFNTVKAAKMFKLKMEKMYE